MNTREELIRSGKWPRDLSSRDGKPYRTVRYSRHYQGLMFGFVRAPNWDSQCEGEFPTEESAAAQLALLETKYGLIVLSAL